MLILLTRIFAVIGLAVVLFFVLIAWATYQQHRGTMRNERDKNIPANEDEWLIED